MLAALPDYVANSGSFGNNFHGKRGSRVTYDGLNTRAAWGDGAAQGYVPNPNTAQETAVETGGISPENSQALIINMIPKDGGNTFNGEVSGTYSGERLQADNLTDEPRARGATTASKLLRFYNTHGTVGGRMYRTGSGSSRRPGRWAPEASCPACSSTRQKGRRSIPRTWSGRRIVRSGCRAWATG